MHEVTRVGGVLGPFLLKAECQFFLYLISVFCQNFPGNSGGLKQRWPADDVNCGAWANGSARPLAVADWVKKY